MCLECEHSFDITDIRFKESGNFINLQLEQ
jgi:hypothetical protein